MKARPYQEFSDNGLRRLSSAATVNIGHLVIDLWYWPRLSATDHILFNASNRARMRRELRVRGKKP